MASERIHIGESISGRVAESGQAIITADSATNALTLPAHRLSVRADRTGALMCVPIKVESRLLGTLHIFRERGYHFNAEALRIAMSLADQAAIADRERPAVCRNTQANDATGADQCGTPA